MAGEVRPIRRVVTGDDAQGRSCVLFDSAAPNVNPGAISRGTCMTDIWVYQHMPALISGARDDGNLPFHFEPPAAGGHLRIVQSNGKPADCLLRFNLADAHIFLTISHSRYHTTPHCRFSRRLVGTMRRSYLPFAKA